MNIKIKKCSISRANIVHFETLTLYQNVSYKMVQLAGLEPVRVASLDPKSSASANSAIAAYKYKYGAV